MAFENIAGYEKLKETLVDLQDVFINIDKYKEKGLRLPKGLLLVGDPGVGKTVIARTFAKISENVVELRAADCVNDDANKRITEAFLKAREKKNSILLIDELDKIAESNDRFFMETNDSVMKVLLQELDKDNLNTNLIIVSTCNNIRGINPALLRAGRFDKVINVGMPTKHDRTAIINYYLNRINIDKKIDKNYLIQATTGFSGADIECLINEAGVMALKGAENIITDNIIRKVMMRLRSQSLESELSSKETLHIVAVHEAGHALAGYLLTSRPNVIGASVIPQGGSSGRVEILNDEDSTVETLEDIKNKIVIALSGLNAEEIVLKKRYASSGDDMWNAYAIASKLVTRFGYYGPCYTMPLNDLRSREYMSQYKKATTDKKIMELITTCDIEAKQIIEKNLKVLEAIAKELESKYILSNDDIIEIFKNVKK